MLNKKAQITIFVILGIVLLILVGLFLYITKSISMDQTDDTSVIYGTLSTPPAQVTELIESCANDILSEALVKVGVGGGYIYPSEQGFFAIDNFPWMANSVDMFPGSGTLIPYWYHLKSSNDCSNCVFEYNMPLLEGASSTSIQSQLEDYVVENIDSCINDFSVFTDSGLYEITKMGDTTAKVTFSEINTWINLEYPIEIKSESSVITSKDFVSVVDLDMRRVYDLAFEILIETELSPSTDLFEYFTLEIINFYSLGEMLIPPIEGPTVFTYSSPKMWFITDVQEDLSRFISENIAYNQIIGSENYFVYLSADSTEESVYNRFEYPINFPTDELSKLEIDFSYFPWWNMYVDVNPGSGVIMPEMVDSFAFIPVGMKTYKFSYDVAYPIVVSVKDDEAFNLKGYTFQFAFEVNIRSNQPLSSGDEVIDLTSEFEDFTPSLFSNLDQRTSGNVTVKVLDAYSGLPLSEVLVLYECGEESTLVGESSIVGIDAIVTSQLPICIGGLISAEKEGYAYSSVSLDTSVDQSGLVVLELEPISNIKLDISTMPLTKELVSLDETDWIFRPNTTGFLRPDEFVILVLERQGSFSEPEFTRVYYVNSSDIESANIELISGQYRLEMISMLNLGENYTLKNITIPEREDCHDTGLFSADECVTLPAMSFNETTLSGGVLLDNSTSGFFNVTRDVLKVSDKLTVYSVAVAMDQMTVIEDLEQLNGYSVYSTSNRVDLEPMFG